MTRYLSTALVLLLLGPIAVHSIQNAGEESFTLSVLTTGLEYPWEIAWGPDGYLWVTERTAKRVTRVNSVDGSRHVAVTIPEAFQSVAQDGVLGLALHPRLSQGTGEDYVYVAYTYQEESDSSLKVQRFSYDPGRRLLVSPVDVITGLPAHDDHLGGRLVIGPDEKLYLTIGDQGSNWLQNFCNINVAQDLPRPAT